MLILTRRVGEEIIIGDEVTVHVLGIKGNQVRIGVDAPRDVSVHREEIQKRIDAEKEEGISTARPSTPVKRNNDSLERISRGNRRSFYNTK